MEVVRQHFVPSVFTTLGHLDATRSNIKSTKERVKSENKQEHKRPPIWIAMHQCTGRLHGDQTGELPVLGRNKEKYLSVFYDENSNYIHVEAINNQSAKSL